MIIYILYINYIIISTVHMYIHTYIIIQVLGIQRVKQGCNII